MLTRKLRLRVACMMMIIIIYAYWSHRRRRNANLNRMPHINRDQERTSVLKRMYLESDRYCHEQLRMKRGPFQRLCARLRGYGLVDKRHVKVEEQVAIFLNIVGHDQRNRNSVLQFIRSGETVSRYFHLVLTSVLRLYKDIVKPATITNSPTDGSRRKSWHDNFKDAVGAIDGTHIRANVPIKDQPRYRNRKGFISQNVLVACGFDMKFHYVLAGWEGSAHDGRLLRCAVSRSGRKLTVPIGKYYLADAGFPLVPGFLTPYRGTRYHLKDHAGHRPQTPKELFNYYHSSLRNVVERTIGLLKKRFAYLRNSPFHDIDTQAKIVIACCALHNFLRDGDPDDISSDEEEEEEEENGGEEDEDHDVQDAEINIVSSQLWTANRDSIAEDMWAEYSN